MLKPSASKRDAKRRSTFDPFSLAKRNNTNPENGNSTDDVLLRRAISQDGPRPKSNSAAEASEAPGSAPGSPPVQDPTPNTKRFSMMRFRHASDSQLNTRAKRHDADSSPPVPAMPPPPAIITTSPTMEQPPTTLRPPKRRMILSPFQKRPVSYDPSSVEQDRPRKSTELLKNGLFRMKSGSSVSVNEHAPSPLNPNPPASSGNVSLSASSLAPPQPRLSESSRSDASSGDHISFANQPKPQKTPKSNRTSRFRMRSTKKDKPLFPLPVRIPPPSEHSDTAPATPRASTSGISTGSAVQSPSDESPPPTALHKPQSGPSKHPNGLGDPFQSPTRVSASATNLTRNESTNSMRSARSSPVRPGLRDRSNTMGSLGGRSAEDIPTPPHINTASGRNSTSTAGRSSFSNLFGLHGRFRHNSEPHSPRHSTHAHGLMGTPGVDSHTNSLNISRETLPLPEREEGEPPGKYLERVEEIVRRSRIAALMCKNDEPFSLQVLRSFMRRFAFFGDPIDMAVRKLLMEAELPAETQQIDRFLQGFADRYHECNPGIYTSPEKANYIAFSIMILHTDFFNKNNKRKMQKQDYVKNSSCEGVSEDVLGCIYDNIVYTPFIHVEDDHNLKEAASRRNNKKNVFRTPKNDLAKKAIKEPVDPYVLIFENKLEALRPTIKDVMNLDDPYSYYPQGQSLEVKNLHKLFVKYGVLQVVSARSRPEAFMNVVNENEVVEIPEETQVGFVDIPVTKVGIVWRKDTKRKAARSPWQEWGAILTRSGLSIFKNATWAKNLMHQYENHVRQGHSGAPVVFKPALQDFRPDHLIPLDGMVALLDSTYKKHKNAFIVISKSGTEEIFLADSEPELHDWLGMLNYSAAFETFAVRPRGLIGGSYEGQRNRGIRRLDSSHSTKTVQTATGEVTIQSGKIDQQYAQELASARRDHMLAKIEDSEEKLSDLIKQLDGQLRDARHLILMAPVQPRTREQVVQAAGLTAAKIKWTRTDIWRLKCHRDMLAFDLEDEKKKDSERQAKVDQIIGKADSTTKSKRGSLAKLNSKASQLLGSQKSPHSPTVSHRQGAKGSRESKEVKDVRETAEILDDVFKTPTELSRQNSPTYPPQQWELPPISFSPNSGPRRGSQASGSAQSPKISSINRRDSLSSMGERLTVESLSDTGSQYQTPPNEEEEEELAAMQTPPNREGRTDATSESEQERTPLPGSPGSNRKGKVRRSFQRTLRDSHDGSRHRRSGKGKESTSTAGEESLTTATPETEVLTRVRGSFNLHGKKASVITFGNEWQTNNTPAEERLKERRLEEEAKESAAKQNADSIRSDRPTSMRSVSTATVPSVYRDRPSAVNPPGTDDEDAKLKPAPSLRDSQRSRRPSRASSLGVGTEPSIKEGVVLKETDGAGKEEKIDEVKEKEKEEQNKKKELSEKEPVDEPKESKEKKPASEPEELNEKQEVAPENEEKNPQSQKQQTNGLHGPKEQSVEA